MSAGSEGPLPLDFYSFLPSSTLPSHRSLYTWLIARVLTRRKVEVEVAVRKKKKYKDKDREKKREN